MKVADYIVQYIADQGINKIFQVYGSASASLIDAFVRVKGTEYVCVFDERAGGFAAEGFAKAGGKFGVLITTSGPGLQNAVTPIANCFYDSVPCLFISGQVHSRFMRSTPEIRQVGFQECDVVSICKSITKYAVMLTKAEDVKYELEKCLYLMKEGRPGPVLLDVPLDIQKTEIDPDTLIGYKPPISPVSDIPDDGFITSFLNDLLKSKRPAIMVGQGVKLAGAIGHLYTLGYMLKIPIFPTWNALDIVTSDYEYYGGRIGTYGGPGRNFGIQNCDLLLCLGTRISGRITGGNVDTFARGAKTYLVDIDPANTQTKLQQRKIDVSLCADVLLFLRKLISRLQDWMFDRWDRFNVDFSDWTNKVLEWRDKYDPVKEALAKNPDFHVHPYLFLHKLSEHMEKDDIIVGDCGGNIVAMAHSFKTKQGQTWITNNGNSPMGGALGYAMGAKVACPEKRVVCITGDGGMTTIVQELQTLKNYGINLKVFILDNRIYGITKGFQKSNFEGRFLACGPDGYIPPDFQDVCNAYKIAVINTFYNYEIDENIDLVFNYPESCVGIIHCDDYHSYFPKIGGWQAAIEEMEPHLPRKEFLEQMIIEPTEFSRSLKDV